MVDTICSVEGCERKLSRRDPPLCAMHEKRWLRHGDPMIKRRARGVMDAPVVRPQFTDRQQQLLAYLNVRGAVEPIDLAEAMDITISRVRDLVSETNERIGSRAIVSVYGRGYKLDLSNPDLYHQHILAIQEPPQ